MIGGIILALFIATLSASSVSAYVIIVNNAIIYYLFLSTSFFHWLDYLFFFITSGSLFTDKAL
jgi:hypothetical protein